MEVWHPVAPQKSSSSHLALAIGTSVGLHLLISAFLLGTPSPHRTNQAVSFIDLKNVQLPAEAPPPAPAATPPSPAAETLPEPEAAPELPTPTPATPAPPPAQGTDQQQPQAAPQAPPPAAQVETSATTLGLGMNKGYFSSIGNGETLRDSVRGYYLEALERVNERWWREAGGKKGVRPLIINLVLARSGEIVDARVAASSGDPAYDKAVLATLVAVGPFPPLPAAYHDDFFLAPIKLVPPLDLMGW